MAGYAIFPRPPRLIDPIAILDLPIPGPLMLIRRLPSDPLPLSGLAVCPIYLLL